MKEGEDHGNIGILFGCGDQIQAVILDENKGCVAMLYDGGSIHIFFPFHQKRHELVNN